MSDSPKIQKEVNCSKKIAGPNYWDSSLHRLHVPLVDTVALTDRIRHNLRSLTMQVRFPSSSGVTLEGILWTPPDQLQTDVARGAIVCHPHPQYGGTMHNKVVFRTGRALRQLGMAVLRFNFRGVGRSTGSYDYGHGERADVQAAIDYLNQQYPQADIVLAGFSFGAWVGLAVGAQDARVSHLIGIGMPVNMNDFSFLVNCSKPKLFIQGSADEFGSVECMQALLLTIPEPKGLALIEGADHFFHRKLEALADAITHYFRRRR